MSYNKLPRHLDNKLDYFLYDISHLLCPLAYEIGFTPNGLTSLSAIFGSLSALGFYRKTNVYQNILYLWISLFFDCMDGIYARMYNQTTKFGHYFDHVKDVLLHAILYLIIMKHCRNMKERIVFSLCISVALILTCIHINLTDLYYTDKFDNVLDIMLIDTLDEKHLLISRNFGINLPYVVFSFIFIFFTYSPKWRNTLL